MNVSAVVVVVARPGDVDVLAPVGGLPMVRRSVRVLLDSGLVGHVALVAADPPSGLAEALTGLPVSVHAELSHALLPVRTHAGQRAGAAPGDGVLVIHDAARPLAPAALVAAVVDAVRAGARSAVPVLPLTDTVKRVDADGSVHTGPERSALRVAQTPLAIRADLAGPDLAGPDLLRAACAAGGGPAHAVPGHPMAFAVRSAWDLELADLLVGGIES